MNQPGIDFSIARARIAPGVSTALHSLTQTYEAYYILSGRGRLQYGTAESEVGPTDIVLYPPGVPQTITNIGQDDLIFLCACVPRFKKEEYVNLEQS